MTRSIKEQDKILVIMPSTDIIEMGCFTTVFSSSPAVLLTPTPTHPSVNVLRERKRARKIEDRLSSWLLDRSCGNIPPLAHCWDLQGSQLLLPHQLFLQLQ